MARPLDSRACVDDDVEAGILRASGGLLVDDAKLERDPPSSAGTPDGDDIHHLCGTTPGGPCSVRPAKFRHCRCAVRLPGGTQFMNVSSLCGGAVTHRRTERGAVARQSRRPCVSLTTTALEGR